MLDALAKEKESDSTSKHAFDQAAKFHKEIVKELTLTVSTPFDIFFFGFIIPAELSSTCYTTTEAPVIAHHAKLGGLRLAPKGPAIHGGAPPIKEKKGRGVNWFTYRVAFVRAQTHLHYLQSRSLERGGGH